MVGRTIIPFDFITPLLLFAFALRAYWVKRKLSWEDVVFLLLSLFSWFFLHVFKGHVDASLAYFLFLFPVLLMLRKILFSIAALAYAKFCVCAINDGLYSWKVIVFRFWRFTMRQ